MTTTIDRAAGTACVEGVVYRVRPHVIMWSGDTTLTVARRDGRRMTSVGIAHRDRDTGGVTCIPGSASAVLRAIAAAWFATDAGGQK